MTFPPTGRQFTIRSGADHATMVELGGGLRSYVAAGRELLDGFTEDEPVTNSRGQVLAPWPNRIEDGRYEWEGAMQQLPLAEPARGNAMHGLVRFVRWECVRCDDDEVVLRQLVLPQPGYPFTIEIEIAYAISGAGLEVTTAARNLGTNAAPWASGQHPYLAPPDADSIDMCAVQLGAATHLVTNERGIPVRAEPVDEGRLDLRSGRSLAELSLDTAFTDLTRDDHGIARTLLTGPSGIATELWIDTSYPYLQLFTGDSLSLDRRRRGLAVEPMTAPANALRTGQDVIRLKPHEQHISRWGLRAHGAPPARTVQEQRR